MGGVRFEKMEIPSTKRFFYLVGTSIALAYVAYVEVPAVVSFYRTGRIVFKYHANIFVGVEALVMHVCFVVLCLLLAYLSYREFLRAE